MNLLSKTRQTINPPYSGRDLLIIFGVLVILAAVPLTIFLSLQRPSIAPRAATLDITMGNYNQGTWSTVNPSPGQSVRADVEVYNYGDTSLPGSIVRLYPFKSGGGTGQGPVCNEASSYSKSVPALSPGQIYTASFTFTAPSTQGIYYAWAFVDATCIISETYEDNNSTAVGYVVGPITANIKADGSDGPTIPYNTIATLTWSSTNSLGCSASGGWSGGKPTSGSESTGNLTSNKTYTIQCGVGGVGSDTDSVTVNVSVPPQPKPTVSISANPPPKPGGSKPPSSSAGTLDSLQLEISVPYLIGSLKVKVNVGGADKEIEVAGSNKSYTLDFKGSNLSLNKEYNLVITSDKTLLRKTKFTPTSSSTNLKVGDLILGDLNQDNTIDSTDQLKLVDSIASQTPAGDVNVDQATNSFDWAILLANFGKKGD
jgi:hypothetical protein